MSKRDSFVSVAMVTNNHGTSINLVLKKLHAYLLETFVDFEIVIVDQRSEDETVKLIEKELSRYTSIRLLVLAFPVAHDVAVAAALENSIGDFVIVFSPGYDPISCIGPMVEQCRSGTDIIVGVSSKGDTLAYRILRPFVGRLLRAIGYALPKNATNLRCLSRRTVNAVTQAGRFHHQLFVRIAKTGYPSSTFEYQPVEGKLKRTLSSGVKEALRLLVFNSTKPLRWMSAAGIGTGLIILIFTLYDLTHDVLTDSIIDGTTVLILLMSLMFTTLFVMLGFFGEYLGRLLDDRGEQFNYFVVHEKNSSVMLDENRMNVLQETESNDAIPSDPRS